MLHWIMKWRCKQDGHPYPPITVPIVGQRPGEPETEQTFCTNCGAHLYTDYTDNAGTERRAETRS